MNQLEERLRTAGRSRTDITPDLGSIRRRGLRIRRNRQIGTSLAAVALVGMGGVAAFDYFRPEGDTTVVSATEGDNGDDAEVDTTVPAPDDTLTDDTTVDDTPREESGDAANDSAEAIEVAPVDVDGDGGGDGSADDIDLNENDTGPPRPSPSSVWDGAGGWLTVRSGAIEHLRADGSSGTITFPEPPGGFAQRWPADVVTIDGRQYLLVDQFINRSDLAAERVAALAESYGLTYNPEGGTGLEEVATPQELDSLEHWEIGILAVDLTTDEIITVENRVVHGTHTPDWFYNGHITSDGTNIVVMRELWQGHCLYVEGLTLDGRPVDVADSRIYAKPEGLDSMTFEEIDAVQAMQVDPPQPCRTLAEVPDSGLTALGTVADSDQMAAFRTAFFEGGLG